MPNRSYWRHWRIGAFVLATLMVTSAVVAADKSNPKDSQAVKETTKLKYPLSKTWDHVDDYHGTEVADPYRWLEEPDSPDARAWIEAQNELTFGYLKDLPHREAIRKRLTELWNYERYSLPRKRGERYLFTRNDGLQNQSVLYTSEGLHGEPQMLLDPNTLSEDGTIALAGWRASEDGKLLAYGLAHAGSDWREWKVLDIETGEPLEDHLKWIKFSGVSWLPDGSGFFYSRYDEPQPGQELTAANYYQKLFFHKLGTPQEDDRLIYQRPDQKEWGFDGEVTEDGRYLIISVWRGTERKNQLFYKDLRVADAPVVELIAGFDAAYDFVGNDEGTFYLVTDFDAPLRRVIAIDIEDPPREHWRELIPESDSVLEGVGMVSDFFIALYLKDARSHVSVFDLKGEHVRDVELPGIGSAGGFGGRRDHPETFFAFTNYTTPGTIYRYNVETGETTLHREPKVDFNPGDFETRQVFYTSKDGTRVPMFITSRKGLNLNGDNPTILHGYGGFNVSQTPGFSVSNVVWLEQGGVYATANLRGGGEYGREWHEAGMKDRKQNVFDDFLAAAEWLIDNKYTRRERLAIRGGSNGGLLVGAAMTQRPELFACALPAVGVMDMLRFHKFTIGWAWVSEYGSSDDPAEFKKLLTYSPLHNLKPGVRYPATLVTTGDHDDRVAPFHSFKYAAALQAAHAGEKPVLIRIETRGGHGAGKPTAKIIEEAADVLSFALENTK
jgi:prolyl oligopeptidase